MKNGGEGSASPVVNTGERLRSIARPLVLDGEISGADALAILRGAGNELDEDEVDVLRELLSASNSSFIQQPLNIGPPATGLFLHNIRSFEDRVHIPDNIMPAIATCAVFAGIGFGLVVSGLILIVSKRLDFVLGAAVLLIAGSITAMGLFVKEYANPLTVPTILSLPQQQ